MSDNVVHASMQSLMAMCRRPSMMATQALLVLETAEFHERGQAVDAVAVEDEQVRAACERRDRRLLFSRDTHGSAARILFARTADNEHIGWRRRNKGTGFISCRRSWPVGTPHRQTIPQATYKAHTNTTSPFVLFQWKGHYCLGGGHPKDIGVIMKHLTYVRTYLHAAQSDVLTSRV